MRGQDTDFTTVIMVSCITVLGLLLIWALLQNSALEETNLVSRNRLEEREDQLRRLERELAARQLELESYKARRVNTTEQWQESASGQPPLHKRSIPGQDSATPPERLDDVSAPSRDRKYRDAKQALAELRYDDAIGQFSSIEADNEDYLRARLGMAHSYFYAHRYEDAVKEFNRVLEGQPAHVVAAVGLANAYQRLEQYDKQIEALNRAIESEPANWLHYNSRATAYLVMGDLDTAMLDYREAARRAGERRIERASALENIGIIHLRRDEWLTALEHANDVNRIDSNQAWNWLVRGIAAARLERNIDAYVSYEKWYRLKKASDPYLLKQLLPEYLHVYVDTAEKDLPGLIDPPLEAGAVCVNNYQCQSRSCRPGPPDNKENYCVLASRDCAAPGSIGYMAGEFIRMAGMGLRCYRPADANPRWTRDPG